MMLGFIYVVLTAKPISIRRLCLLYIGVWASARFLLSILRIEPAASLAVEIAVAITLLVWGSPLARALFGTIFGKRIALEAFETVSVSVQFSYGFTSAMALVTLFQSWLSAHHALTETSLIQVVALASIGGVGFVIATHTLSPVVNTQKPLGSRKPS
jgi:type III secretory pathway component EscU